MTDQATAAKPFATKLVVLGCGALALTACVGLATLCVALGFQVQRQTEEHLAGARAAAAERRWVDASHLADEVLRIAPNHPEATRLRADASAHLSGLLQTLRCDRAAAINALAFSPDGALLACASGEDVARIWDVQTGRPVHTLGHSNFVAALAYSPDGQLLATAAHSTGIREPTIRLWKSTSGTAVLGFGGGAAEGAADGRELVDGPALAFSPDGRMIASGNINGSINLWDSTSATRIRSWRATTETSMFGRVSYLTFVRTEGGAVVASYGNDKMVKLWDPATGRERSTISGVRPPMALSLDGRLLASRVAEGSGVIVVEVGTGRQVRALSGHDGQDGSVSAVVVSHDGAVIVSAYRDIKVWLAETGAVIRTFEGHAGPITALALSQDGRRLASGSDGTVKVWDLATGER